MMAGKNGMKIKQLETAKKMLKKKIEIDIISEVTGLAKEEILKLNS